MEKAKRSNRELLDENERLKTESLIYKKVEEELRLERKLYVNLTNALPWGVYRIRVFSTESSDEERWHNTKDTPFYIEFTNDRFSEILKIDKEVFEKNPGIIINAVYEKDKADFANKNAEANIKLIPFKWDGRFNIQGEIIWVHFESLPSLLENGDVIWTGIFFDNSESKRAEQEIKQKNEELQKMNSEKDKFLSIIAHDLKSPFNSILGFSELLAEQVQNNNAERINQYSQIILNSSRKANDLLTNLMEWSQLQTGRMDVFLEYFELNVEINNVIHLYNEIANQKAINVCENIPDTIIAYADKQMINAVLRNLVSNAIKFTRNGGSITISAKNFKNEILISVSDTGVGIPPASREKLFCLEENISTRGTQNEKGTGLGLLLCKEFIEKNNGEIWVESEQGVGSNFHFKIPNSQG